MGLASEMIKDNISRIKARITETCSRINRNPAEITIVAISKGRTTEDIKEVIEAGITDIGENKIQEAVLKFKNLRPNTCTLTPIKWHMVGHLQTNKVKDTVNIFDLIHSVDSFKLAREIDRQARNINKTQDVLIEVNTSFEENKFGVHPNRAIDLLGQILSLKNIRIKGLMTMAPLTENPEDARPYFRKLRMIIEEINKTISNTNYPALSILSMGMTQDYQIAIEEGANMLRIGRAIFQDTD